MFLLKKGREALAPQTLNHLRGYLSRAFSAARKTGRYVGENPVNLVGRRKVPRRPPDFLKAEEVPALLKALDPRWRPLFATAIYAGLRKGELAGLRKADIDLNARLLTVARSYDRDTTKGGHADRIPIAAELVVTGWRHVCRRKGCGHVEKAPDTALRHCPKDGCKLWPKPVVRPIRFHDTRHSTASLLMMSGANPAAVQRIMRHSDPKLTSEVYGHLAPEYLRAEVDRLAFEQPRALLEAPKAQTQVENRTPFVPRLSPNSIETPASQITSEKIQTVSTASQARQAGLEPTTLGLEGRCSIQLSYWRKKSLLAFTSSRAAPEGACATEVSDRCIRWMAILVRRSRPAGRRRA